MLITIRTGFKDVVRTLLIEQEILPLESKFRETGKHEPVIVECEDDLYYRSISTWAEIGRAHV